jgi:hypothetical protein
VHDNENRQSYTNTTGDVTQAPSVAERLYNLFVGNERRHVKSFGPPVKGKSKTGEDKWKLDVKTHDGPATLALWQAHLSGEFILSIIPLLDNGTCWFAVIDADEYELDYVTICHRIRELEFPLLPFISKSAGLHLFVVFKEPAEAAQVIPSLKYMAIRLGLKHFEIFPSSPTIEASGNTRAVAMPYGAQWDVLPEQSLLTGHGNRQLLETCLLFIERARITAEVLPEVPKVDGKDHEARKIPLYLQVAINSLGPYPNNDRSPVCASIIWQLAERGFKDVDEIQAAVENRGPFVRYNENNRSLKRDIKEILKRYETAHPNAKAKVEICTDIVPWDPAPPSPIDWSVNELIAAGSITALWGDSGVYKSFVLWNMAVARMFALPFAHRKVTKRCGVMMWLAEGKADYRIRCRAALKYAGLDPNQQLPLIMANEQMLPLVAPQSAEQLHGIIDKANTWLQERFGLDLGCILIDTVSMAALFEDAYKPNEIIAVNRMLTDLKIDTAYTDHFPKGDKEHAAGTLHKRNSVDQILTFKNGRMTLDKARYGPNDLWNKYRAIKVDDDNGNKTLAIWFGPTQQPTRTIDNAQIFMSALQNAQQDFGRKMREGQLKELFVELHLVAQEECGVKSASPKEQARSAFRRELESAVNGRIVASKDGDVWVLDEGF